MTLDRTSLLKKNILFTKNSCRVETRRLGSLAGMQTTAVLSNSRCRNETGMPWGWRKQTSNIIKTCTRMMWTFSVQLTFSVSNLPFDQSQSYFLSQRLNRYGLMWCFRRRNWVATWLIMRPAKMSQERGWEALLKERFILQNQLHSKLFDLNFIFLITRGGEVIHCLLSSLLSDH